MSSLPLTGKQVAALVERYGLRLTVAYLLAATKETK